MQTYRKRITKEQKFNILTDHFEKGTPISELARLHGINPVTLYQWKRLMGDKPEEKINIEEILRENEKLKKDNDLLNKALGKAHLSLECGKEIIEILKKNPWNISSQNKRNPPRSKRQFY